MTEIDSSAHELDAMLHPHGAMNFSLDCTCEGLPARLTMNEHMVLLAVSGGARRVHAEPFLAVASTGAGEQRTIGFAGRVESVVFADSADAGRFDRVLGVRQGSRERPAGSQPHTADRLAPTARPSDPASAFQRYAQYTLAASAVLVAVGWVNAVLGVILAVVLAAGGYDLGILYGLIVAVAGSALPLCVGFLARMMVFRYRAQDASS